MKLQEETDSFHQVIPVMPTSTEMFHSLGRAWKCSHPAHEVSARAKEPSDS